MHIQIGRSTLSWSEEKEVFLRASDSLESLRQNVNEIRPQKTLQNRKRGSKH